jgi:hypothetical protein
MRCTILTILLFTAAAGWGQTTQPAVVPATEPAAPPSADQLLNQMLRPSDANTSTPLQPQPAPSAAAVDASSAGGTGILREGTDVIDRMGRLQKSADGQQDQFIFESDGKAMQEAPLTILPNLKLMSMETATSQTSHDLRFRVTGTVTEYRGHNYILLEKVVVVPDKNQEF